MPGFPAFQANAFQQNAFQSGVGLVAGDFSLGSPVFATPIFQINYQLSAPPPYWLGSPVFATPPLTEALIAIAVNPYWLGSPTFTAPFLRATQRFTVPNYSLSLAWGAATLKQNHKLSTNAWSLGALAWSEPRVTQISALTAPSWSVGALIWSTPIPIAANHILHVDPWWLGSPAFGFPLLRVALDPDKVVWPLTYHDAVEEAAAMLRKYLDLLLASIPSSPITKERNTVRRLISVLRSNAEQEIRGRTLGTQLANIIQAADAAGPVWRDVDAARLFLMSQAASKSVFTQIVFRSALIMTLALESKITTRTQFKTQAQIRNAIVYMRDAFDSAKALGLDEVDMVVYQTLTAMSGTLINHLATIELQLPRFVTYRMQMPMPSLYLANRIYQDTRRADEIERENKVVHPAFCPINLRVLSVANRSSIPRDPLLRDLYGE